MLGKALRRLEAQSILYPKHRIRLAPSSNAGSTSSPLYPSIGRRCYAKQQLKRQPASRGRPPKGSRRSPTSDHGASAFPNSVLAGISFLRATYEEPEPSIPDIKAAYDAIELQEGQRLTRGIFFGLAHATHEALRQSIRTSGDGRIDQDLGEVILTFSKQLIEDLKSGVLEVSYGGLLHLLSTMKELGGEALESGQEFWEWLRRQDDHFSSATVYGAAIELLVRKGFAVEELEELYQEALTRFPGNFNAYNLSPHAIVPHRDRPLILKGVPINLLQAIFTARLMHGDSRNAYLALDTALRLVPCQTPSRFFTLPMATRPLLETFTVFAMSCRSAGRPLGRHNFEKLIQRLGAFSLGADLVETHIFSIRAMLSAVYLHAGQTRGNSYVYREVLYLLILHMTLILRTRTVVSADASVKEKLFDHVRAMIKRTFEIFSKTGTSPDERCFSTIIETFGGADEEVIVTSLTDMKSLSIEPTSSTRRAILVAAGTSQSSELIKLAWEAIVDADVTNAAPLEVYDFLQLIKSASAVPGLEGWVPEQCEAQKTKLTVEEWDIVRESLESGSTPVNDKIQSDVDDDVPLNADAVLGAIECVVADLGVLGEGFDGGRDDWSRIALQIELLPPKGRLQSLSTERKLYDELTTDQAAAKTEKRTNQSNESTINAAVSNPSKQADANADIPSDEPTTPPFTQDNQPPVETAETSPETIPLDELRFQNWRSINTLLEWAERHDTIRNTAKQSRIGNDDQDQPRTDNSLDFSLKNAVVDGTLDWGRHVGLSEIRDAVETDGAPPDHARVDEWRRNVLELRGYDVLRR